MVLAPPPPPQQQQAVAGRGTTGTRTAPLLDEQGRDWFAAAAGECRMHLCRDLDIRKFLDGIYVSEKGTLVKA